MAPLWALKELLSSAQSSGQRTSALNPIQWFTAIVIGGLVYASGSRAPDWVIYLLGALLTIVTLVFLGSFIYFVIRSPDALRSEKFVISKMAIERGYVGDSASGLLTPTDALKRLEGGQVIAMPPGDASRG